MNDNIASRAMRVSLSVSMWTARRLDKQATNEVTQDHGAASDAGKFNKMLLPKEALAPITQIVGAARMYFYAHTLPWDDNGDRVLLNTKYFDYMQRIGQFGRQFDDAVDKFCSEYNMHREKARFRLNSLFKEEDYPDEYDVRMKFAFQHRVKPLPTAGDFRVDMVGDEVDRIRAEIEQQTQVSVNAAMASVWEELKGTMSHLHARLADPKAKFHASTVTNLDDLLERLPHLNLTQDPKLEQFRKEIKDALGGMKADELRKDDQFRSASAAETKRILDQMAGVFG